MNTSLHFLEKSGRRRKENGAGKNNVGFPNRVYPLNVSLPLEVMGILRSRVSIKT